MADDAREEAEPLFRDTLFHRRRKHGKWDTVDAPQLEGLVADTHAHVHLLADPALSLARASVHSVAFICDIVDVYEDGDAPFCNMGRWEHEAAVNVHRMVPRC